MHANERGPGDRPCFLCGKKGHWISQCPLKGDFDRFQKQRGKGEKGGEKSHQGQTPIGRLEPREKAKDLTIYNFDDNLQVRAL
uniref:CCHC-type domain-containing protein n=1 Tax=Cyanoderma ruficeps TaxID=181631 RepID=A0A8C3REP3_9PASS